MFATADRIVNDTRTVFDDVVEDFVDTELICRRFAKWRSEHNDSYTEAYISLCVSKLVVPLVRHSLITWNPLQVSGAASGYSAVFNVHTFSSNNGFVAVCRRVVSTLRTWHGSRLWFATACSMVRRTLTSCRTMIKRFCPASLRKSSLPK